MLYDNIDGVEVSPKKDLDVESGSASKAGSS
jgi:hypothetical protein